MQNILSDMCSHTRTKPTLFKLKNNAYAVFLHTLLIWIQKCGRNVNGLSGYWIYNSLQDWHKLLHFWSPSKIRRVIKALEDMGVLLSKKVNAHKWNHTKWYTVDMERLEEILKDPLYTNTVSCDDTKQNIEKKRVDLSAQNEQIITINKYTLINSSNKEEVDFEYLVWRGSNPTSNQYETQKTSGRIAHHYFEHGINSTNTVAQMIHIWNGNVPDVQITTVTTNGYTTIKTPAKLLELLKTHFKNDLDIWATYAKKVASSGYLMGKINKGFKPRFAFLTRSDVIQKVQQGEYGVIASNLKQEEPQISEHVTKSETKDQRFDQHTPACEVHNEANKGLEHKENPITRNNSKKLKQQNKKPTQEEQQELQTMKDVWDETFKHSGNPIPFYASGKNQEILLNIWNKHFSKDKEKWRAYAIAVNSSSFLMGEKKKTFRANFSWLIQEETIQRIQGGDYGIGDRELDMNKIEANKTKKVKEIANAVTEKLSSMIQKEESKEEFNNYLISKQYQQDGDKYGLSNQIHPMVSTVSLVHNTDYKHMYNHLYDSYIMKKHSNVSLVDLKSNIMKKLSEKQDMASLRAIEYKIRTTEVLTTLATERYISSGCLL